MIDPSDECGSAIFSAFSRGLYLDHGNLVLPRKWELGLKKI